VRPGTNARRDSPAYIEQLETKIEELEGRLSSIRADFEMFLLPGDEGLKLTTSERMLCKLLHDANRRPVGRGHLYDALYSLKPEADWADEKIIDVFICKIRRKLVGSNWRIKTEWGVGYSLHKRGAVDNGV
jgi:DNA-binding response OmpR family regulator